MAKVRKYEGSAADRRADAKGAKKARMTLRAYEKTSEDRRADTKGQKALDRKSKKRKRK